MNFHAKPVSFLRSCLAAAWILSCAANLPTAESPRDHFSLDLDWKFHLGDDWPNASDLSHLETSSGPINERFNDSSWLTVSLPHDWAIELPFDGSADKDHGHRPIGPNFPNLSVNGVTTADTAALLHQVSALPAGSSFKIGLSRDQKEVAVQLIP